MAIECSVDLKQLITKCTKSKIKILNLLAENDSPKILEQNSFENSEFFEIKV